jgi:hypothetical protein
MYQLNYIYFIDFRNLQIEMHVVHPRQVIVVGTVRRPIDDTRPLASPLPSRAANIYFLIFSLFKHWTGSHTNLEHTLVLDRGPTAGSRAAAVPLAPLRGSQQADGAYSLHSEEDEDLLD